MHLHGDRHRRSHRLVHRPWPDQRGQVHLPSDGDQRARYRRCSPATTAIVVGAPTAPTGVSATAAQNAQSTVSWTDPTNTGADPLLSDTATATDVSNPSSPTNGSTCIYYEPASPNYNAGAPADQCTVTGTDQRGHLHLRRRLHQRRRCGCCERSVGSDRPLDGPRCSHHRNGDVGRERAVGRQLHGSGQQRWRRRSRATRSARATPPTPRTPWSRRRGRPSPITVTGLTNGDTYSFTVAATNVSGTGPASGATTATPATVPGAPTNVTATVGGSVGSGMPRSAGRHRPATVAPVSPSTPPRRPPARRPARRRRPCRRHRRPPATSPV